MAEPYLQSVYSKSIKIRWISVQCYEIVLPGGKVLITDPFYWDMKHFEGINDFNPGSLPLSVHDAYGYGGSPLCNELWWL